MSFDVRKVDLERLNTLTKYPAIPTYHTLDPKNGGLLEEAVPFEGTVLGTEKIDGTNARIICLPDESFILGSREQFLYARGDLIGNPAMGIIQALADLAERLRESARGTITVYFVELFGGKVTGASKQYTGTLQVSYRLFDVMRLPAYESLLERDNAEISHWRENGGQPFAGEDELQRISQEIGIALTPRRFTIDGGELPQSIAEMADFLKERLPGTECKLDEDAGGAAEGLVLRTPSRSVTAKARFEDYERTLKRRGGRR